MRHRTRARTLAAVALLLVTTGSAAAAEEKDPATGFEVGQVFPELVLPSLDGGAPASIRQFHGQKVILHVFASW